MSSSDPSQSSLQREVHEKNRHQESSGSLDYGLNILAQLQVPHGWFVHFYVASLVSSIFWAFQLAFHGWPFQLVSTLETRTLSSSMTLHQLQVTWLMMFVQGSRRLCECLLIAAQSKSSMWFAHWIIGVSFYLAMGMAVWIEGAGKS